MILEQIAAATRLRLIEEKKLVSPEEMKEKALSYNKTLVLQTTQSNDMDYKKAKLLHNRLTESLAEEMKKEGKSDLLIMTAGPYRHHSCMSAYCVDAQEMADATGMTCWGKDGKVRYFSQVLFHDTGK